MKSRHLRTGASKHLGDPIGMRETANGKSFKLPVQVIFDAPDCWRRIIEHQVGRAMIAVVREAHAAGISNQHF